MSYSYLQAIVAGEASYHNFIKSFLQKYFPMGDAPRWAFDALNAAGIILS